MRNSFAVVESAARSHGAVGPYVVMDSDDKSLRNTLRAVADLLADFAEQRASERVVAPSPEARDVSTPPCPTPATDYLTPAQYAERRGVSRTTVFDWIRTGLPSVKQGGSRRIRWQDADAFLDAGRLSKAKHRRRT